MPVFQRIHIREALLPIVDKDTVDLCKKRGLDLLLASVVYDSYMITGQNLLGFLVPNNVVEPKDRLKALGLQLKYNPLSEDGDIGDALKKGPDLWITTDLFIKGIIYLDGNIIVKGKDILVGAYSYQEHKNGFVWGHDLRNRCVPL